MNKVAPSCVISVHIRNNQWIIIFYAQFHYTKNKETHLAM